MQGAGDRLGDFALDIEDIGGGQLPVEGPGPEMSVRVRIDELGIDTNPVPCTLHAAFQHGVYAQLRCDLRKRLVGTPVALHPAKMGAVLSAGAAIIAFFVGRLLKVKDRPDK